jgi:AraC family transcriptional regulator
MIEAMTETSWTTEASVEARDMALTLMRHGSTGPLERTHCVGAPTVSLFLAPSRIEAAGCYGERPEPGRFRPFGTLVMVPADLPLHVRIAAAPPRRLVCCRFDRARFGRLTRPEDAWEDGLLRACLDIRLPRIEAVLRRLAGEVETPGLASDTLIEGLGLVLLAELARFVDESGGARRQPTGGLAPWQLRRVGEILHEGRPPKVSELARQVGLGSRHFMRAFKQSTGRTVMDYAAERRLQRAMACLTETRLPIAEIARLLGFAQASAFSHAFRRMTGETPVLYRRRHS